MACRVQQAQAKERDVIRNRLVAREKRVVRGCGGRTDGKGTQRHVSWVLSLVIVGLSLVAAPVSEARDPPGSFADLVERLSPAVVNISTTQLVESRGPLDLLPQLPPGHPFEDFFKEFQRPDGEERKRRATSLGSGFVLDKSGIIVTNNHVVEDADEINVIFQDGERVPAELVGLDNKTDIAVLRIDTDRELVTVEWGNSDAARVGDWVVAIGNPFGLGGTVTAGIISARGRDIRAGPYDDFIQTDASINKGNSGGPLFDLDGKVIGINTAIFSQTGGSIGIGFAVPESLARPVIDQLITYGRTKRGWLGVRIQSVTDEIAEGLGLEAAQGVLVAEVPEGGPAHGAGIQTGDVILSFDGKTVDDPRQLSRVVAETAVGKVVELEVMRDGEKRTFDVKLGELEAREDVASGGGDEPGSDTVDAVGMKLANITPELARQFELDDDREGVIVVEVESGSEADQKGIRSGDIVVEVQLKPVQTLAEVNERLAEVKASDRKTVLLLLQRGNENRFIALNLPKE
jgi:serine protease Do